MFQRLDHPEVIAEIGANHDGYVEKAHRMVDAVSETGATWVKFQLYVAEELVADRERIARWGPPGRQVEEPVGAMFDRLALAPAALVELFAHARERGLIPFATPFSERGIDILVDMGAPMLKIASSDVTHHRLLSHVASTRLPAILSIGKSTLAEVDEAVQVLHGGGCDELALLHCVATYPAPIDEANLRTIPTLQMLYPDCTIGFSDHTEGLTASIGAVALGAQLIERHVTLSRDDRGPDHWFSIEMDELAALVTAAAQVDRALGDGGRFLTKSEEAGRRNATRSLIASRDLAAGTVLTADAVKIVRPGTGIPPKHLDDVIGLRLEADVAANTPLMWSMFQTSFDET